MAKKRRVPKVLDRLSQDTRKPGGKAGNKLGEVKLTEAERRFFADMDRGVQHVYVGKRGLQKGIRMKRVVVHLPYDYVEQLRLEAEVAIPRKTVSEVIRERLGVSGY